MKSLLYLVHRIPYPPNKGDKIRSYNILRYLSQFYEIYLGTFIDTPEDLQYQEKVSSYCIQSHFEEINPRLCKIKSLTGFLSGQALSIPYYSSNTMQQWVDKVIKENDIKTVLAFSSPMAQFVMEKDSLHKVMDFIDIDSDKWKQYSQSHKGLMGHIYAREAEYLFHYEKQIADKFDASTFVSNKEAAHFKQLINNQKNTVSGVSNGIDFAYFDPDLDHEMPYPIDKKILVFVGAMDYWANCDAVIWFAETIFKKLHQLDNNYQFYIVGSNPAKSVQKLAQQAGVFVTGRVDDVRPYIAHAFISVAPLRIARGIQNKVLEAMAMNKVVIATENAMEGIEINDEIAACVEDSVDGQVKIIQDIAREGNALQLGESLRQWVKNKYQWDAVLEPLKTIIEDKSVAKNEN